MSTRLINLILNTVVAMALALPLVVAAASPNPEPPEPLAPLAPLEPLEPLAPLAPLTPCLMGLYLTVGPEVDKLCLGESVNLVMWVRRTPCDTPLDKASATGWAEPVPNALVTVTDNGQVVLKKRTSQTGFVDWNYAPKKAGDHKLVFTVTPPSNKYDKAQPVSKTIKVERCPIDFEMNYKESCLIPNNAIPNQFNIHLKASLTPDDKGKIPSTKVDADFDFVARSNVPECTYTYSGMSGSFPIEVSGSVADDVVQLQVKGGKMTMSPGGTATCQGRSKTFTFPTKSVDVVAAMKMSSLSFPISGDSQSFGLPKMLILVGTGKAYADVTLSLQSEGRGGQGGTK